MDTTHIYETSNKIPIAIPYQSSIQLETLTRTDEEENKFISRNQFRSAFIFSGLWLSYCWWLSERYRFDFGQYTIVIRLLFCILHVLTVWKFFQYMMRIAFRFYRFTRRLRASLPHHFMIIGLSLFLFLLLTIVLNFKQFLREAFAIVD
ncbi:hypothetical protein I4U23_021291 [Adineta vaga]|nr:hypothetical protein I4U23_021291 [Adineta vaga]